jgi:cell division protein FtsZ
MPFGSKFEEVFGKPGSAKAEQVQTHKAPAPAAEKASDSDEEELAQFLKESMPKIYVVGSGGSGCNTVNRMNEVGIAGAKLIAMNTDAQHLLKTKAEKRLLLGKKRTRGLGAGSNPSVGEEAAMESEADLRQLFQGADMVFVTCGMGGGTGTGSAPVIARIAKESKALVIGVVTFPFSSEGNKKLRNAMEGIEKLRKEADTTIVIPNDKLLFHVPDLPLNAAFKASDQVLTNAVKGITELITKPGLVNLDFADVVTVLSKSGTAMIGLGEVGAGDAKDRVMRAADLALSSPLLDLDVSAANKALVSITGGEDMTLGEVEGAVNSISSKIAKESMVKWGATIDNGMSGKNVRVLAVLAGIKEGRAAPPSKPTEELELDEV